MKVDGAHSRQPTHLRKRKAPGSSQDTSRPASPQGNHDGGLGEPARGSSSTSCHPPGKKKESSTLFCDLPAALQRKICSHLGGDPYQKVRDLTILRCTSRAQSENLRQVGYPWSSAQELEPLVRAVGQRFREEEAHLSSLRHLLDVQSTLSDEALLEGLREHADAPLPLFSRELANRTLPECLAKHVMAFGPALGFLSPGQRGTLVRRVGDIPDEFNRSLAIGRLGQELAHLEAPKRENLVNAALMLTVDPFKAYAITGLLASLEHLGPSQRDHLVATAINLPIGFHRFSAIRALAPKLALLEEDRCAELAQATADLPKEYYAFWGLFKGLAGLDPARRKMIIDPAMENLDRAGDWWQTSVALLPGVGYLSESQRARIIDSARASLHLWGDCNLGYIIGLVAPAMNYMGRPFLDAMFIRAINVNLERGKALRGLGMCIAHLDEAQREALLRAASSMPSEEDRAQAIGAMAAGVVHLDEDGRNTLIAEVKRLKEDPARNSAIRELGESESLQYLSPAHRQDLIAAATHVDSIFGLAKSMRHLTQPERELLLDAADRLAHRRDRAAATAALAKATAEAPLFREPDMREQ